MVRPEDLGAVGDGVADDTRAVQAALDRGAGASVLLAGRSYRTSATLLVPSGTTVQGIGAVIQATADDQPILVSKAWAEQRGDVKGRTRLLGLRLAGTGRGARQDGIVLHDFWSEIADCEVSDTGGRGIVLTAGNRFGVPIASTLVENRVRRCVVRDSGGACFFLGEPANGKLTDGELADCIGSLRDGVDARIVTIGHAAGWAVRNIHTYGGRPGTAIEIRQGYFTRVSGLYVEGFAVVGLALPAVQTDVTVADVQIVGGRLGEDAAFIGLSGHKDYADPLVVFSTTVLTCLEGPGGRALLNEDGKVRIGGAPILVAGPGAATVRPGDLPAGGAAAGAVAPPKPEARRIASWTGRGPRAIALSTRGAGRAFAEAMIVTVAARSSDGAATTRFAGLVQWSLGEAGQAVLVDLVPFGAPVGFQQPPVASFAKDGNHLVLTLSFTPIASGPGSMTIG